MMQGANPIPALAPTVPGLTGTVVPEGNVDAPLGTLYLHRDPDNGWAGVWQRANVIESDGGTKTGWVLLGGEESRRFDLPGIPSAPGMYVDAYPLAPDGPMFGSVMLVGRGGGGVYLTTTEGQQGTGNGVYFGGADGEESLYVFIGAAGEHSLGFDPADPVLKVDGGPVLVQAADPSKATLVMGNTAVSAGLVSGTFRLFQFPVSASTPVSVADQGFTYDPVTGFFLIQKTGLYAGYFGGRFNPDALVPVGSFGQVAMTDVSYPGGGDASKSFDNWEFAPSTPPGIMKAGNNRAHTYTFVRRLYAGVQFRFGARAFFDAGTVTTDVCFARLTRLGS